MLSYILGNLEVLHNFQWRQFKHQQPRVWHTCSWKNYMGLGTCSYISKSVIPVVFSLPIIIELSWWFCYLKWSRYFQECASKNKTFKSVWASAQGLCIVKQNTTCCLFVDRMQWMNVSPIYIVRLFQCTVY